MADNYWVKIWIISLSRYTPALEQQILAVLSESEQRRLKKISHPRRYKEYLVSRALMRHAIAQTFQLTPANTNYIEQDNAPPKITGLPDDTCISLSHSKTSVLLALSNAAIGIDIETKKYRQSYDELAKGFMTANESSAMQGLSSDQKKTYFYQLWSAKEAVYKLQNNPHHPMSQQHKPLHLVDYDQLRQIITLTEKQSADGNEQISIATYARHQQLTEYQVEKLIF